MTPRLYGELAHLWPLLSPPEDYAAEAGVLRSVLRELLGTGGRATLLDLGTGGGHHLHGLVPDFAATAVDRSPEMLAHSRRLNPGVEHHVGDFRAVRLGRRFDACLIHDALAYLRDEDEVRAALATATAHLRPGGALLLVPDRFRETFVDGELSTRAARRGDTEITLVEYVHDPDPDDTTVEVLMIFLIREKGRVRVEEDRHTVGLFARPEWLTFLDRAGLAAELRPFVGAHKLIAARYRA